ncbi:hypothetical protein L7F22_016797 [Adiantum nelumboides]|nr:hypothetical protein [Adiantum nelumboides]
MQQQYQLQERLRKAREAITDKLQRFEEWDISKFCRLYEQSMEDNGIQDREAVDGFHLIVVPELRTQIVELQTQQGTDWPEFKKALQEEYFLEDSQRVETNYKTVAKKVKPVATPLPEGSNEVIEEASRQPILRDPKNIGHKFTEETLKQLKTGKDGFLTNEEVKCFQEMLMQHGKAFAFDPNKIGCVDPSVVSPMIIFNVPHMPWSLQPIPVPKAHLPKLIDLLNEKIRMGILEPSCAPYFNRWFTVPKKNGTLRFIQDMQPVNKVTIRNVGTGPIVDEFVESFAGRAIYSMGDLYSGYNQF